MKITSLNFDHNYKGASPEVYTKLNLYGPNYALAFELTKEDLSYLFQMVLNEAIETGLKISFDKTDQAPV